MTNDTDLIGLTAEDTITKFRGIVTAEVRYISGCTQACLSPPVDADGKQRDGVFFDIQRLKIDHTIPRVILAKVVEERPAPPGFDRLPPPRDRLP